MKTLLFVALGGSIGASGRYLLGLASAHLLGRDFPWGTFFANVLGGLLMGLLVAWLALKSTGGGTDLRAFAAVGVLGGFTTFSAFSLEAWKMIETKAFGQLWLYVGASVLLAIAAVGVGLWIGRKVFA